MKPKKPVAISIGICAYNEEENILDLLHSIVNQRKHSAFSIQEILIVSDSSTDATDRLVKAFPDKRVVLHRFRRRMGKPSGMNFLIKRFTGEHIVFLDADIILGTPSSLAALVMPLINNPLVGLVGARYTPTKSKTFIDSATSNYVWARLSLEKWFDFSKTALCIQGHAMAASRDFIKHIVLRTNILSDDAFLYFTAVAHGVGIRSAKKAIVLYSSPQTLTDEIHQSLRHYAGTPQLYEFFTKEMIDSGYILPQWVLLRIALFQCFTHPFGYLIVKVINLYVHYRAKKTYLSASALWDVIESSKSVGHKFT